MTGAVLPLKADRFLRAALEHLEPLRGTHIYDAAAADHLAKTERLDRGYREWLGRLLRYVRRRHGTPTRPRMLDFGCGTGELTVLANEVGFAAFGVDLHRRHVELGRILARENGYHDSILLDIDGLRLPFIDKCFDVVLLLVVIEHLEDNVIRSISKEIHRVCHGFVYVIVPNKLQTRDDHTGLRLVPWLPNKVARTYIRLRGKRFRYAISQSGTWDVYYRYLEDICALFEAEGFEVAFPPDELVYPPLASFPMLFSQTGGGRAWLRPLRQALSLWTRWSIRNGRPKQAFYPYLNLVFSPKRG